MKVCIIREGHGGHEIKYETREEWVTEGIGEGQASRATACDVGNTYNVEHKHKTGAGLTSNT